MATSASPPPPCRTSPIFRARSLRPHGRPRRPPAARSITPPIETQQAQPTASCRMCGCLLRGRASFAPMARQPRKVILCSSPAFRSPVSPGSVARGSIPRATRPSSMAIPPPPPPQASSATSVSSGTLTAGSTPAPRDRQQKAPSTSSAISQDASQTSSNCSRPRS